MNNNTLEQRLAILRGWIDRDTAGPLYRQVAKRLDEAIRSGLLADGEPLPPKATFAESLGVSQMTIRRAIAELKQTGLIESVRGRGTTVTSRAQAKPIAPLPEKISEPHASGRMRLGVVFASVSDGYPFLVPLLRQLEAGTTISPDTQRPALQTFYVDPEDHDPESIVHQLPLDSLDGLLLMSPINTVLLAKARQQSLPCVLLFNDLSDIGSVCVLCDYMPGLYAAVQRLVASGCRRAALVTAGNLRFSTGPVLDAITFSCQTLGLELPADHVIHADYSQHEAFNATLTLLKLDDPPDCIVYCSEAQAEGGLLAAEQLGVNVPETLSMVALGGAAEESPWSRRFTIIDMGLDDIGLQALEAIFALAQGKSPPRRMTVRSRLIAGQTTR